MLFSPDNNKLIAEWFMQDDHGGNITIIYDSVVKYEHNQMDKVFSYDVKDQPGFMTNATTALTSLCKSASSNQASSSSSSLSVTILAALVLTTLAFLI